MRSSLLRTTGYFSLAGLFPVCVVVASLWGPESGLLRDAYRAESERLFEAFAPTLAKATAQNDDLAKIDELRRLQKLPAVASATISEKDAASARENVLIWEGKTVGVLEIRLRKTRWRLWHYRWLERALSLGLLFAILSGVAGVFYNRVLVRHKKRVILILKRQHVRMEKRRRQALALDAAEQRRRLGQAMGWVSKGLLVLDANQRLIIVNPPAAQHFRLGEHVLGSHWLDYAATPEWAYALRRSVENPGITIPGPASPGASAISLLSVVKPGSTLLESTWISIG